MFKNNKDATTNLQISSLKEEISSLKEEIKKYNHQKEIFEIEEKFKIENQQRVLAEKDLEISKLSGDKTKEINFAVGNAILTIEKEKNFYKSKCEILEEAFKNLGFDVKDMRAILDKLVDGLIAKNQIQLIK